MRSVRMQSTLIAFKGEKEVGRSVGDTQRASILNGESTHSTMLPQNGTGVRRRRATEFPQVADGIGGHFGWP